MLTIGGILGTLVIMVVLGVRYYLNSRQVADKVTAKLAAIYGGPVQVGATSIGVQSSTLSGVAFLEEGQAGQPWLTIDRLDTDLSLLELVRGQTSPDRVTISGVKILLRFDKEGKLSTRFPEQILQSKDNEQSASIPEVSLERGQVTLRQDGNPDFVLDNVACKLQKEHGVLVLSASADNSRWGRWTLGGNLDENSKKLVMQVKSAGSVPFTESMLEALPVIPRSLWREVRFEQGETGVEGELSYDLATKEMHFAAQLHPKKMSVALPRAGLLVTDASCLITIKDDRIELRDVEASAFAGKLRATANLQLFDGGAKLDVPRVEALGLDVSRFPPGWEFPPQITGKLRGTASLRATLSPGKIETAGSGSGELDDAYVAGQPAAGPIKLELRSVAAGFRFGINKDGVPPRAADRPGTDPNATKDNATGADNYFDIHLKMKDVDLGKFEQDTGVKLPFVLAGKVSFEVNVGIPLTASRDLKKYKVHGNAQLSDFVLGDLKVSSADTEVVLANGVLQMTALKGTLARNSVPVPGAMETGGTFAGKASFPIEPLGELQLQLELKEVPLSLVGQLSGLADAVAGDLSATMTATVPGKSLKDVATWQARGYPQQADQGLRCYIHGLHGAGSPCRGHLEVGGL